MDRNNHVKKKLLQFGAGNIGRSFIGQVFARGEYEVVFADIDTELVRRLNEENGYRLVIKRNNKADEIMRISGVRGVDGRDINRVADEAAGASYISTSVGKTALPHIMPALAAGLERRNAEHPGIPVDIIIAENIRNGADFFRDSLRTHLPADFPLERTAGFVETSIGKMVPIMKEEHLKQDPLWVFAEEYNSLIVSRKGFLGPVPDVPGIKPVENITAYVDRKLFIHNLGHAAAAYLGYRKNPQWEYIWEPLEDPSVYAAVQRAMEQSAAALHAEYREELLETDLQAHIDDLLRRFQNRALGDTVYRVGRDLKRKLSRNDRLTGAMLLAEKHGLPYDAVAEAAAAAFLFRKKGEDGRLFPLDRDFAEKIYPRGTEYIVREICGLDPAVPPDTGVAGALFEAAS